MKRSEFIKISLLALIGLLMFPKIKQDQDNELRTVQYYENGYRDRGWHDIAFEDVKDGMLIRMFETNGMPVKFFHKLSKNEGQHAYARGDAFLNVDRIWTIALEGVKP